MRYSLDQPALRRIGIAYFAFCCAEWATWIAMLVFAYERGGVVASGTVAVVQLVPSAICAPFLAAFADRHPRGGILGAAYAAQAIALAITAAAIALELPLAAVYAAAALAATSITLTRPAQSSLLPRIVRSPAELTAANGAVGAIESAGILVGPMAASVLLAFGGAALVYTVMAGALTAAAIVVASVRVDAQLASTSAVDGSAGLRALATDRPTVALIGVLAIESVQIGSLDVLFVALALGVLGIGDAAVGLLNGALGIGGVLGAVATAALVRRRPLLVWLAVGVALWGAGLALIGTVRTIAAIFAIVIMAGAARGVLDVSGRTLLQRTAPTAALGRAFGLLEGSQMAALAIGAAMAPLIVETLGVAAAFVIAGLLGPAACALMWPWLRRSGAVQAPPARVFELVDGVPAFARMPLASRDRVARAMVPLAVGVGGSIVREGERGDRFFIVDTGEVEISIRGTHIRTLGTGASFGELALLHDIPRTATARARSDVRLYALDRAEFVAATSAAGGLARRL